MADDHSMYRGSIASRGKNIRLSLTAGVSVIASVDMRHVVADLAKENVAAHEKKLETFAIAAVPKIAKLAWKVPKLFDVCINWFCMIVSLRND